MNPDFTVMVFAYPKQGRVTIDGSHFVIGERGNLRSTVMIPIEQTSFAKHIQIPHGDKISQPYTNDLGVIFQAQLGETVERIDLAEIRAGPESIVKRMEEIGTGKTVVFDAETDDDIQKIAMAVRELNQKYRILRAGSAAFLEALAGAELQEGPLPAAERDLPYSFHISGKAPVMIVSTVNEVTDRQTEQVLRELGGQIQLIEMNVSKLLSGDMDEKIAEIERLRAQVQESLSQRKGVILRTSRTFLPSLYKDQSQQIVKSLAGIILHESILPLVSGLFLTGGEAIKGLSALSGGMAEIQGEYAPGVPWGVWRGGKADGLPIISKAGGFGAGDLDIAAQFFKQGLRPVLGVTMGDPLGIGPEVAIRALAEHEGSLSFVIGNGRVMEQALEWVKQMYPGTYQDWQIKIYREAGQIRFEPKVIPF
jgi:uncharacterized protein YgbK (DUF1537 family)